MITIAKYNIELMVTPNKSTKILWDISKFHNKAAKRMPGITEKITVIAVFIFLSLI